MKESIIDLNRVYAKPIEHHVAWLRRFDRRYLVKWQRQLKAHFDGAICEALFRELLEASNVIVTPNEDLDHNQKSADFRCEKDGNRFYVEVTCMDSNAVDRRTEGPPDENGIQGVSPFGIIRNIFNQCSEKTPQLSELDAPGVLAIGTFARSSHWCIGPMQMKAILTGEPGLEWDAGDNSETASNVTHLRKAAFFKDKALAFCPAHQAISAILIGQLRFEPQSVYGVLNPQPIDPFQPNLLPTIEFYELAPNFRDGLLQVIQVKHPAFEAIPDL